MNQRELKQAVYKTILLQLEQKIIETKLSLKSATESRDNDTKSSAGDKHETARAMVQIEIDKSEDQLKKTIDLQSELLSLNLEKEYKKIEKGCLVITNTETFFISIGLGKILFNDSIYYAISLASPIGALLKDKVVGDKVQFNGKEILVKGIF
jgi:hypothetical protein